MVMGMELGKGKLLLSLSRLVFLEAYLLWVIWTEMAVPLYTLGALVIISYMNYET